MCSRNITYILFLNEVLIDKIANDIAEAEDSIKNTLGLENAFE